MPDLTFGAMPATQVRCIQATIMIFYCTNTFYQSQDCNQLQPCTRMCNRWGLNFCNCSLCYKFTYTKMSKTAGTSANDALKIS